MGKRSPVKARDLIVPQMSPHEKKLAEMHDALHSLGDQIRKPFPPSRDGNKLLPDQLQPQEPDGAPLAKQHIDTLHSAFKALRGKKNG